MNKWINLNVKKDWCYVCFLGFPRIGTHGEPLHPRGTVKHVELQILPSCCKEDQLSPNAAVILKLSPPPTRTITFFVAVLASPLAPARLSVVNLQVTNFRASEFENAYCARISSPSRGIVLSGASMRSINNPCAIELTIAAISASRGSRGLPGV